jgi:hypothetical protein
MRINNDSVELQGVVLTEPIGGGSTTAALITLPVGYRPPVLMVYSTNWLSVVGNNMLPAVITVSANGLCTITVPTLTGGAINGQVPIHIFIPFT